MRILLRFSALALLVSACVTNDAEGDLDLQGLIDRADRSFRARDSQAAIESFSLAAMIASQEGDNPAFVVAAAGVTMVLSLQGEVAEAASWHSQAQELAQPEDGEAWIRFLLASGALLVAEGLPAEGIDTLTRAWAAALAGERPDLAMQAAQLAAAESEGGAKVAFGQKVLDAAVLSGEPTWISAGHEGLGWIHQSLDQSSQAIESFRRARRLIAKQPFQQRVRLEWALGRALRLAGEFEEADLVISTAQKTYHRLSGALRTMGNGEWKARLAEEQGELAVSRGDLPTALRHLRHAQKEYEESGAVSRAPQLMDAISQRIAEVRLLIDLARTPAGASAGPLKGL